MLVALLPTASVTVTTSVVPPVVPAVYRPAASTLPPEPLVVSANEKPAPLPPDAVSICVPRGATVAVAGASATPPPTETLAVALLPRLSVTRTTSVVLAVEPAV